MEQDLDECFGSVFDSGTLELGQCSELVVPHDAGILQGAPRGRVELYLEKSQMVLGSVGMNLRRVRHFTGAAWRAPVLATYGNWSCIHGGRNVRVVLKLPPQVSVRVRLDLSGPGSPANRSPLEGLRDLMLVPAFFQNLLQRWIHGPALGWKPIRTRPDPDKTVRTSYPEADLRSKLRRTLGAEAALELAQEILALRWKGEAIERSGIERARGRLAELAPEDPIVAALASDSGRATDDLIVLLYNCLKADDHP